MNNWLLLALISFIVYIPSFNASGSYSSSSGGRRTRVGGGKGGSDIKGRPTGTDIDDARKGSKVDDSKVDTGGKGGKGGKGGEYGSNTNADKDYRDIIDYISKEINKDDDYTKNKGSDGSSYPQRRRDDDIKDGPSYPRRNDDYRNDDYRNDDYRNGPPSYIPYAVPSYGGSDGNKGGLYQDLLWKLVEQGGSIAELEHKAEKCDAALERIDELEQLLDNLQTCTSNIPPSLGVNVYICTSGGDSSGGGGGVIEDPPFAELMEEAEGSSRRRLSVPPTPPCVVGEIVILAGKPTSDQEQYLEPANGCEITDSGDVSNSRPSVCQVLYPIYGDDDIVRRRLSGATPITTCRTPDLSGKYLVGADSNNYSSKPAKEGSYYGRRNLGDYSPRYPYYPSFEYFPPKVGECIGSEFLQIPDQCPLYKPKRRYPPKPETPSIPVRV